MSLELSPITRENLDSYLNDLSKEYRKLGGKAMPAEIVLIGGAAVLANYGFRELTYDIDAIIVAASAMKDAIMRVRDKHGLPQGWFNADFKRTASYSDKLLEVSSPYKTFSHILSVRTITAEYLLAMKLMSGRRYKYDMSDVVGILWEHHKDGKPIERETVEKAIKTLYGNAQIPSVSAQLLNAIFAAKDYEAIYREALGSEAEAKKLLLDFERKYPHKLKSENIDNILDSLPRKRDESKKKMLEKLAEMKQLAKEQEPQSNTGKCRDHEIE